MAWRIKIHPEEAQKLSVTLNGQHAFDWSSSQGHVEWAFPAHCLEIDKVKMVCVPYPDGDNASIAVWWDSDLVYEKIFDSVDTRTLEK